MFIVAIDILNKYFVILKKLIHSFSGNIAPTFRPE